MEIKLIEFEFGMTQNLGDYTNTRPSVKLVAELAEGEDVDIALESLTVTAVQTVHGLVDDELEAAGRRVKYYDGPLYQVNYSDVRQCILILPITAALPNESNWRHADQWQKASYDFPAEMRRGAAWAAAEQRALKMGYTAYQSVDDIPPLPDPGPEPLWHVKGLEPGFKRLGIRDEATMEELAQLDHVTDAYLNHLYRTNAEYKLGDEQRLELIRSNAPWPPIEDEPEEDDEDDWDEEEDEDEDTF